MGVMITSVSWGLDDDCVVNFTQSIEMKPVM